MTGDQRPCRAGAGALNVEREQRMKSVKGDEVDLGQVDYQCAAVGCQLATWWLNSSAFEASISPLIEITVSPVSVFALMRARRQSKNVLPLRVVKHGRCRCVLQSCTSPRRFAAGWRKTPSTRTGLECSHLWWTQRISQAGISTPK